jgi:hypothetical protein
MEAPESVTVLQACAGLVRHPVDHLVRRWNWKAALMSAMVRGAIFFGVNVPVGLAPALRAVGIDAPLRLLVAGSSGAIMQAFRQAEPRWAATALVVVLLALLTHGLEYVVHAAGGTPRLGASIAVSIMFSGVSAAANLTLMRRGLLLVGTGARPFLDDLRGIGMLLGGLAARMPIVLGPRRGRGRDRDTTWRADADRRDDR